MDEIYKKRFWSRVQRGAPDECWEWQAFRQKVGGHGRFALSMGAAGVRNDMAHRFAWEFTNGAIPKGKYVLHKCNNPPCCNPAHLYLGTPADNMRDRRNAGGYSGAKVARGSAHGVAKLTEASVLELLTLRSQGWTLKRLATRFAIDITQASNITMRKHWAHVPFLGNLDVQTNAQALKTHCIRGHAFDALNTGRAKDGSRVCRQCNRERQRK